jgi:hypothetical protein
VPTATGRNRVEQPTVRPGTVQKQDEEENTRVCPAAVIENLLNGGDASDEVTARSAADELTKVGQVPIEELVLAERALADANVGHEDVTRTYSFSQEQADPPSQVTAPGKRQQRIELQHEPLVIIQPDPPRRSSKTFAISMLLIAACAAGAGWNYRSAIARQSKTWQASFLRGIAAVTGNAPTPPRAPARAAVISLSINVAPADAVLTIDGSKVANPYLAQRSADRLMHTLIVEAPGYTSLQRQVQFDRDLTVVMALAPLPKSAQPEVISEASQAPVAAATSPRGHGHKAAVAKASQPASAAVQGNCSPPYVIDAAGIKTYKPECL